MTGAGQGLGALVADPRARRRWCTTASCSSGCVDPKGGMELSAGAPLFHRFAYDAGRAMADLLDDAVADMQARAGRLRGKVRAAHAHRRRAADRGRSSTSSPPSPPTSPTATSSAGSPPPSPSCSPRAGPSGSWCVAALQDPRKEVAPARDLFPARIALRLIEPEAVASCSAPAPVTAAPSATASTPRPPGVGFMWCDGAARTRPVPGRLGHRRRHRAMVERYRPGHGDVIDTDAPRRAVALAAW